MSSRLWTPFSPSFVPLCRTTQLLRPSVTSYRPTPSPPIANVGLQKSWSSSDRSWLLFRIRCPSSTRCSSPPGTTARSELIDDRPESYTLEIPPSPLFYGPTVAYLPDHHYAASCRRGHVINRTMGAQASAPSFCPSRGAPVVRNCGHCGPALPGSRKGVASPPRRRLAAFCFNCGGPHPWASREQRVRHLENLLEFQELEEVTQLTIIEQLAVLAATVDEATDEERVEAGTRLRRLAPRMWDAGLPILQTVLTGAAKRKPGLSPPE